MIRFFNQEVVTSNLVRRAVQLDHEIRVAAAIFNQHHDFPGTAALRHTPTPTLPRLISLSDILAAIERVNDNGEEADTIVMSPNVLNRVKLSTKLQNFVRGSRPNDGTLNITASMIADAFSDNGIKNASLVALVTTAPRKARRSLRLAFGLMPSFGLAALRCGDPQGGAEPVAQSSGTKKADCLSPKAIATRSAGLV
jgi:hypothetical protein